MYLLFVLPSTTKYQVIFREKGMVFIHQINHHVYAFPRRETVPWVISDGDTPVRADLCAGSLFYSGGSAEWTLNPAPYGSILSICSLGGRMSIFKYFHPQRQLLCYWSLVPKPPKGRLTLGTRPTVRTEKSDFLDWGPEVEWKSRLWSWSQIVGTLVPHQLYELGY